MLTREALLAAATAAATEVPLEPVHIDLPVFRDEKLFMKGMSGAQRDKWESALIVGRGKKRRVDTANVRAKLVVQTLVWENGERVFMDSDADTVGGWPVRVLNPLYEVAQRLSGVSDEDVDELEKSSAPTPEPGSTGLSA